MKKINKIDVFIGERHVGTLAETDHLIAFEYSDKWIREGFSLNPFFPDMSLLKVFSVYLRILFRTAGADWLLTGTLKAD